MRASHKVARGEAPLLHVKKTSNVIGVKKKPIEFVLSFPRIVLTSSMWRRIPPPSGKEGERLQNRFFFSVRDFAWSATRKKKCLHKSRRGERGLKQRKEGDCCKTYFTAAAADRNRNEKGGDGGKKGTDDKVIMIHCYRGWNRKNCCWWMSPEDIMVQKKSRTGCVIWFPANSEVPKQCIKSWPRAEKNQFFHGSGNPCVFPNSPYYCGNKKLLRATTQITSIPTSMPIKK